MGEQIVTSQDNLPLLITKFQDASAIEKYLASLQRLLQACVNDEPAMSSIGFLYPLSDHAAIDYWLHLFPAALGPSPETTLLIATVPTADDPAAVVATVQIARMTKETHSYKGEVRKLLVHPAQRRGGVGRRLMAEVERLARDDLGLEMLVLDTATETPARDFYARTCWTEWGVCPAYAKYADGTKGDCTFFVKMLQ
jgi:GNAT superfamily N-acetyltransferase